MANQVINAMKQAMMNIVNEKIIEGNLPEAVKEVNRFIAGFKPTDKDTLTAFRDVLMMMYCLLAKLQFEIGEQDNNEKTIQKARGNAIKAEKFFDTVYKKMPQEKSAKIKDSIRNMVSPDEKLRREGMKTVSKLILSGSTGFKETSGKKKADDNTPARPASTPVRLGFFIMTFLIGLLVWSAAAGCFVLSSLLNNSVILIIAGVIIFLFAVVCGMRGWDWHSRWSGQKGAAFFLISISGIGTMFVFYWTGKCIINWIAKS